MTDRISTDELRHAALARRFYRHVLHGGSLTADDVSIMVQTIEELEAEVIELREALEKASRILSHEAILAKPSEYDDDEQELLDDFSLRVGLENCCDCIRDARAALNHKETYNGTS